MKGWRIDSIDAKAGLAFASLREPWDDATDLEEGVTVLFQPPDFGAQRVASPALAMAAGRGSFQIGLFADAQTEVEFPTLDSVREFVRRVYLRSSGGDFPAGGEGPPLPSPEQPDDSVELPPPPSDLAADTGDTVKTLVELASEFRDTSNNLKGTATALPWAMTLPPRAEILDAPAAGRWLCRAALRLLWELALRKPRTTAKADWFEWLRSATALAVAFDRMHVWALLAGHGGKALDHIARNLLGTVRQKYMDFVNAWPSTWPSQPALDVYLLRHLMFTGWVTDPYSLEPYPHPRWTLGWIMSSLAVRGVDNWNNMRAIDVLSVVPVPALVATGTTPTGREGEASLRHLLVAALAMPQGQSRSWQYLEANAELLLFAACLLTSAQDHGRVAGYPVEILLPSDLTGAVEYSELKAGRLYGSATDWLAGNLPGWVFEPDLEQIIDDAIGMREFAVAQA